jgi:hypothetical protein
MSKLPKEMKATIGMQKNLNALLGFGGKKKKKAAAKSKMRTRKS